LLDDEPFNGVLFVDDGRLSGINVRTADRGLVRGTTEEVQRLTLRGRALASGPTLTASAFGRAFPGGGILVTLALILFAFSTAISWSYYGDRCIGYLLGIKAVLPYRIVFAVFHFIGAVFAVRVVWAAADVANALMALPNLLSLWALSPLVAVMRRRYFGLASDDEVDDEEPRKTSSKSRRPRKKKR
jgi:Na+/alanine symporter